MATDLARRGIEHASRRSGICLHGLWRLPIRLPCTRERHLVDADVSSAIALNQRRVVMNEEAVDDQPEPMLYEAVWQREQLLQLFADLNQAAEIQHVQVRTDVDGIRREHAVTLKEAQAMYAAGQVAAIQIRYSFDGEQWCDTVMIDATTARIIRTRIGPLI
jgi:hypothetical protein